MLKDLQARIDTWTPKQKLGDVFVQLVRPNRTRAVHMFVSNLLMYQYYEYIFINM